MLKGEYSQSLDLAERAEMLLPEHCIQARSILPYTLGSTYRGQGHYEKAADAFLRVAQMGDTNQNLIVWATGVTEVINVRRIQGRLHEAELTGRRALQKMKEQQAYPYGSLAKLEVALSEVLCEYNFLDEAFDRVTAVITRMQAWDMPTDRIFAYLTMIHIQELQGDFAGANETLQIAKNLKETFPVLVSLARSVDRHEIHQYLIAGNITFAARLMDNLLASPSSMVVLQEQDSIMLARIRLAQDKLDEAMQIINPLIENSECSERLLIWLEILILQACIQNAQDNRDAAVNTLLKALTFAEPEGFVGIFIIEGNVMQSLLFTALQKLTQATDQKSISIKTYITKLLHEFHNSSANIVKNNSQPEETGIIKSIVLIDPLSERELEVLNLIADGLKYEEIANRLFISVNTVRTYIKGIYHKLGVNNRSKAIALAHKFKLIE